MDGFIIIGNGNAVAYKEIFPLIKDNKMWMGASKGIGGKFLFEVPSSYNGKFVSVIDGKRIAQVNNACWFTNVPHQKRNTQIRLFAKYTAEEYPKYDNYDAIETKGEKKEAIIPMDYDGVMGVPITFLDKYCPTQFEIVGGFNGYKECDYENSLLCGEKTEYIDKNGKVKIWTGPTINKKTLYYRILIKKKVSE